MKKEEEEGVNTIAESHVFIDSRSLVYMVSKGKSTLLSALIVKVVSERV